MLLPMHPSTVVEKLLFDVRTTPCIFLACTLLSCINRSFQAPYQEGQQLYFVTLHWLMLLLALVWLSPAPR
jgi:hypothetical protein